MGRYLEGSCMGRPLVGVVWGISLEGVVLVDSWEVVWIDPKRGGGVPIDP